jgi:hypothetical protein
MTQVEGGKCSADNIGTAIAKGIDRKSSPSPEQTNAKYIPDLGL